MSIKVSEISSNSTVFFNIFMLTTKKTPKLCNTLHPPPPPAVTSRFPSQMASNEERVSMSGSHHLILFLAKMYNQPFVSYFSMVPCDKLAWFNYEGFFLSSWLCSPKACHKTLIISKQKASYKHCILDVTKNYLARQNIDFIEMLKTVLLARLLKKCILSLIHSYNQG